jgi:hypothetical protein
MVATVSQMQANVGMILIASFRVFERFGRVAFFCLRVDVVDSGRIGPRGRHLSMWGQPPMLREAVRLPVEVRIENVDSRDAVYR